MSASRTTTGCWTCRIRRKKCDDVQPFCGPCRFRHLTCYGYGSKPAWIDGAENQKVETERIKRSVRENLKSQRASRVSTKQAGQSRETQAARLAIKPRPNRQAGRRDQRISDIRQLRLDDCSASPVSLPPVSQLTRAAPGPSRPPDLQSLSKTSYGTSRALQSVSLRGRKQGAYPFSYHSDGPPADNEHDFTIVPSTIPQPSQLLHYLLPYRILICKECHYAIQPSAISRHLKEIHQIYRSNRKKFIQYAQSLDLADPRDVIAPVPNMAPITFLPTTSGLACRASGCGHLCATIQRMKRHWATLHSNVAADAAQWRAVDLQTFFRGNQLRYFIVCRNSSAASEPGPNSMLDIQTILAMDKLEPPLSDVWGTDDLDLLKHFKSSTYLDIGHSPASRKLWQTTIPLLAYDHSFLMHGILACSALHLAYLNPLEQKRYKVTAAYHQNRALPEFRSAIVDVNENTYDALFAFSQLLIIYCFASEGQDNDLPLLRQRHDLGLPDWLYIIRGNCTIFKTVRQNIEQGPLKGLKLEGTDKEVLSSVSENPEHARRLGGLLAAISRVTEVSLSPLPGALLELSRAFSNPYAAGSHSLFTMWTAVYIWPVQVSQEYLDLLKDKDPAALILLAHYCILLARLDSHWYMSGYSKNLFSRIYNQLDQEWRQLLYWPLEEIGLLV
jgi:hypothetical protein